MKPIYFKIPKTKNASIRVQLEGGPHFYDRLHYHPEYQITLIERGEGIFFGGAGMVKFRPGDIFFIGHNTPHLIKSSKEYYRQDSPGISAVSLFFSHNSFGEGFFEIPEMASVKDLLIAAGRVIKINSSENTGLTGRIYRMQEVSAQSLVILLLQILDSLLIAEKEFLNSEIHEYELKEARFDQLNKVLNYTFSKASENITIDEVAREASLSRSQFSRYFKERTGKTYINFLNELRIENACSQLMDSKNTIEQICYDVGFQNISNFNRQFRKSKNMTPSEYRAFFRG